MAFIDNLKGYEFFDSKDIREYYKENFELSPAETVILIYNNYGKSMESKVAALTYLLEKYTPEEFGWDKVQGTDTFSPIKMYQGVHDLREAYLHITDEPEQGCVYSVSVINDTDNLGLMDCKGLIFSTYEKAYAFMVEEIEDKMEYSDEEGIPTGAIRRYYLDLETEDSDVMFFHGSKEMNHIYFSETTKQRFCLSDKNGIDFDNFYMPINLPFKKGDIVRLWSYNPYYGSENAVFCYSEEELENWKKRGSDSSDFSIWYDFIDETEGKALYTDDAWALSMEKLSEEEVRGLKDWDRYLPVMSLIAKGKYDFTIFENAKLNKLCERPDNWALEQYLKDM